MTPNDPTTEPVRDPVELRRSLRDVVALTMLPTVWAGYEPGQICADLVDVVARMIDADGVYLTSPANQAAEIVRLKREGDHETERCLRAAAAEEATGNVQTVAGFGGPPMRLLTSALSFHTADRFVVASRRADFPTETERLILRVAANQASTWLDWKRAEAAVAAESAFRRAIENSMVAGVAVVDASGRQTYVNRAFAAMVGWPEAELVGRTPPFAYWPPEEGENIKAAFEEVIAGNINPAGYELRFRRRDEQRFDALVLISPFEQPGRQPGFLASVYDITERKSAERTARFLAEAGEILGRSLDHEDTLRAISALVVPRFADWCFIDLVEADGGFRRIAVAHPPRAEAEAIARRLRRVYAPKSAPHGVSQTFARGATFLMNDVSEEVLTAVGRDDEHREALLAMGIRCFVSVPMTSRGTTFGVLTFLGTDARTRFEPDDVALAEEVARRAALAVDNARLYGNAQEANRAKDEFLANLSHELRTPMTAILGWAHLLQLGDLEPEQVSLGLQTIRQSGEAQAKLIDDLLDVSRIVTGKLHLNASSVRLADIAHGAIAAIRPAADAKRHRLEVDIQADDATVLGDASRLQQVFWNLLSNAVKFTPPGGVVRVRLAGRDGENAVLTVEDSGEGIPSEFLPLVFERFRQAATSVRGRTGLGLGLAIAKELVEMHGGSIAASSAGRGSGSTFTVTLPRLTENQKPAERLRGGERPHEKLRSLRVLLVEDDETTRTLLSTVLGSFGAIVTAASCATDAEAALRTFEPQILITDIEMPGNDGVSLLHVLRGLKSATLPAIAVSGYADEASRDRVLAAGFNGFVAKPLDPMLLADEIVRALGGGG
ncbi:MAG TPA: ATP-binding protein [Thermoanaerobaculia bacterium]|jgi:PAS domain S-box-containing protein|nr:ATP-binding protein [Thermoanaerobaculia bacterium]